MFHAYRSDFVASIASMLVCLCVFRWHEMRERSLCLGESFVICHSLKIALSVNLFSWTVPKCPLVKGFIQDGKRENIFVSFSWAEWLLVEFLFFFHSSVPSSFHQDIYKQSSYRLCYDADATASSSAVSAAAAENYEPITSPVFGPSIPWDLVQGPWSH